MGRRAGVTGQLGPQWMASGEPHTHSGPVLEVASAPQGGASSWPGAACHRSLFRSVAGVGSSKGSPFASAASRRSFHTPHSAWAWPRARVWAWASPLALASSSRFIRFSLRGFRYLPSSPTLGPFCFSLDPADLGSDLKLLASNKGVCHNFSSCFDGRGGDAEDDVHKPHWRRSSNRRRP